jgi:branched-chain amino acid transport system substrate-binding protein
LKASGADAFFAIALGKFATQTIRRVKESDWKLTDYIVPTSSTSLKGILAPAGLENAVGLVTSSATKSVSDPQWNTDPGMQTYRAFLKEYMPTADPSDSSMVTGYNSAILMAEVLRRCGSDLTRDNVIKQLTTLKNIKLDMLLPGTDVTLSADDYRTYKTLTMMRFDGQKWALFGEPITE